jgi:DHA1 family tetracycline resistance protein-like MFS transporter
MSVASIAGVASPLFFGAVYSATVAEASALPVPGLALLIASAVLFLAALLGWRVARRAMEIPAAAI